jgi:hypothetical protein
MNIEQFIKLTDAYGATIEHWPAIYQQQAQEVIALNLLEVNQALEKARLLDEMFSSHTLAPAERRLFDSIIASAPKSDTLRAKQSLWQQWNIKSWLGISSFISMGLAGAVAGVFFVSILTSGILTKSVDDVGESSGAMAQYLDVGQEWS